MLFGISWHGDHNETDIRALRMTKETQCATKHIRKIWPVLKQTKKKYRREKTGKDLHHDLGLKSVGRTSKMSG